MATKIENTAAEVKIQLTIIIHEVYKEQLNLLLQDTSRCFFCG